MRSRTTLFLTCMSILILVMILIFPSHPTFGLIQLDDVMTRQDQKRTGVLHLTPCERSALEEWLDENVEFKEAPNKETEEAELALSLNIGKGRVLKLSNDTYYQVAPEDVLYSASWITPTPLKLMKSGDPDFPLQIVNETSGTSVKAKQIDHNELQQVLSSPQDPWKIISPPEPTSPMQQMSPSPSIPPDQPDQTQPPPARKPIIKPKGSSK